MSRYIDADLLYKETEKKIKANNECRMAVVDGEFLDLINDAPIEDVVEVRHGKNITQKHPVDEFICSECGFITRECCRYKIDEDADGDESMLEFEFRYCPCCGAKMDGERSKK